MSQNNHELPRLVPLKLKLIAGDVLRFQTKPCLQRASGCALCFRRESLRMSAKPKVVPQAGRIFYLGTAVFGTGALISEHVIALPCVCLSVFVKKGD